MSKCEYQSVKAAVGGMEALIDKKSKEYDNQFIEHLAREEDKEERLLSNPSMFKTPSVVLLRKTALRAPDFFPVHIVRNGKKATVGYAPDVWKAW